MNWLILCVFFCLSISSSMGISVLFKEFSSRETNSTPEILCKRFEFIYNRGDYFTVFIKLLGNYSEAGVTRSQAVVRQESGIKMFEQQFWGTGYESKVEFYLEHDAVSIDVELTQGGVCERTRVLEGNERSTLPEERNLSAWYSSKTNHICLRGDICLLYVDVTGKCNDTKLRPRSCSVEGGRFAEPTHTRTAKELFTLEAAEAVNSVLHPLIHPSTTSPADASKEGADNTYFTIMIVTSVISVVALILLLITAIRLRFLMKSSPPETPRILTSDELVNPYYENVVFRPESLPELGQREQRVYDVPS